jgi:hypothetical protein
VAIALPAASSPDAVALDPLIATIRAEVKPEHAMDVMRRVYSTDRWFTFPKFAETALYLKSEMQSAGLEQVELGEPLADGVTQYGFWTMPLAWDAKRARLEIVEPAVPESSRVLADFERVPASLGMWSGATPPEGVVAEIVDIGHAGEAQIKGRDLKGKLALTSNNPAGIKWMLARAGALGAINASTENPALKDGVQWINSWGDNGWAFTKGSSPLLCFSISPREAEYVRRLLGEHRTVRVKAVVDSRHYAGPYPYTTAVIPGTDPGEEVLTLGHTSEQGAQDNATGVAAMLESLATLNRLIRSGKLPRPRRSIRVLAMGEMYGSLPYITNHPERMRATVAAMCLDTPASPYELAGTEYTFYMNPHAGKSYTDAFALQVAASYFAKIGRPWHWHEYMTGTDSYLGEPAIGVPTNWVYSGTGVQTHHNSEDTPERVDPRSLRDLTVVNAAFLYYLASAGEPEAYWLAEVALSRGYERVAAAASPYLDRSSVDSNETELSDLLRDAKEKIGYSVDRESQAVKSVLRLVPNSRRASAAKSVDAIAQHLVEFGADQYARVQAAVDRRASALGFARPLTPSPAAADAHMTEASKIVVKRKRIGTITLDDLSPDQREGYPSGAWDARVITALYWCDGRRNLAEVIRLTRLELGQLDFDFVGYFRFLEKHGYVEFVQR